MELHRGDLICIFDRPINDPWRKTIVFCAYIGSVMTIEGKEMICGQVGDLIYFANIDNVRFIKGGRAVLTLIQG